MCEYCRIKEMHAYVGDEVESSIPINYCPVCAAPRRKLPEGQFDFKTYISLDELNEVFDKMINDDTQPYLEENLKNIHLDNYYDQTEKIVYDVADRLASAPSFVNDIITIATWKDLHNWNFFGFLHKDQNGSEYC